MARNKRGGTIDGTLTIRANAAGNALVILVNGVQKAAIDAAGNLTVAGSSITEGNIADDLLVATDKKIQFRDTGIFLQSGADGKVTLSADGAGADDITLAGSVVVSEALKSTLGVQSAAVARTATALGDGTGIIAAGTRKVAVTSANAAHIITLPAPVVGDEIDLYVGANGFELASNDPATVAINGGAGASFSATIGANVLVRLVCVAATLWLANTYSTVGTEAALEAAHGA